MLTTLSWIFAAVLPHLGEIEVDVETLLKDITTGEGGVDKVAKIAGALAKLAETAAGVAASAGKPPTA